MRPDRIEEKLKLLRPVLPLRQWSALRMQYLTESDLRRRIQIEQMIDLLIAQRLPGLMIDQILLPPPDKAALAGDYPIGEVIYPHKPRGSFGVRESEWIRHCGIFGKTGSGKTTLAIRILREICARDKPFLIFDYKRNYRDLLKHPDFEKQDIMIFTVGRNDVAPFFFNPKVKPPGVEEHVWVKQLAEIIEKVYLLGPGANDVFMESAGHQTFKAMQAVVLKQRKRARELLWWASVKRTLNAINYPGLGEMVNCGQGYSIPDLLEKRVILELDGLSASDQAFVIGSLLLWIYHYRMRQPEREVLKHFLIIEEAHHLFLRTSRQEDIADVIMREIRELGEAIIVIDQHPSKISISALGNLATKFCLTLSLNQDVRAVSDAMLLDRDQQKYLAMLTLGQSICRSDRLTQPVLVSIAPFQIQKGLVTDEELKSLMAGYLADLRPLVASLPELGNIRDISSPEILSPLGQIVLDDLARYPILGVVKRFKKLGLKTSEGYKAIEELEAAKLIAPQTIDGLRLYDLTLAGRNQLGPKVMLKGRGGIEHRYYVERIKQIYLKREGFTFIERDDIDLVVETYTQRLAFQIETGKSNIETNILRLAKYKADHKFMIATNRETEAKINDMLRDLLVPDKENIRVMFVKDFLASPPSI